MTRFLIHGGIFLVIFLVIFGRAFSFSGGREAVPVKTVPAGARPLEIGASGSLFDKHYNVTAHAVEQMAEVGRSWERHEYELTDDSGAKTLLICGDKPEGGNWILFESYVPMVGLGAKEAAAKKIGDDVDIDGFKGRVSGIFLCSIVLADGAGVDGVKPGTIQYGFRAVNEYRTLMARWNEGGIQYFRGRTIPAKQGGAAFGGAR